MARGARQRVAVILRRHSEPIERAAPGWHADHDGELGVGDKIRLVNQLQMRDDGRGPEQDLSIAQAMAGSPNDPCIGPVMPNTIVSSGLLIK